MLNYLPFAIPEMWGGLILIDSVHENQNSRLPPSIVSAGPSLGALRLFQIAAHLGIPRIADMPIGIASMNILPKNLRTEARAVAFRADMVDVIHDETAALPESFAQPKKAKDAAGQPSRLMCANGHHLNLCRFFHEQRCITEHFGTQFRSNN